MSDNWILPASLIFYEEVQLECLKLGWKHSFSTESFCTNKWITMMIRRHNIFLQYWNWKPTSQWLWRLLAISFFNFINLTFYLIFRAWGKQCEHEKTCAWPMLVGGNIIISGNMKEQSYYQCCVCNLCSTRWSPVVASKGNIKEIQKYNSLCLY